MIGFDGVKNPQLVCISSADRYASVPVVDAWGNCFA